jgi:uroporphyrinogen decarboxylase
MNARQRFLSIAKFESTDSIFLPSYFQWFWPKTLERWRGEGMPAEITPRDFFGFDRMEFVPVTLTLLPPFRKRALEEGDSYRIVREADGSVRKVLRHGRKESMEQWLTYPVSDRKSWRAFKKRLNPDSPGRLPRRWDALKEHYGNSEFPIGLYVGSFLGWIRSYWVGLERLSYLLVDDPLLIEEMVEHVEYYISSMIKKVLGEVRVDLAHYWEDIAYKNGPLVSPSFFRKFLAPRYKRVSDLLHSYGVELISVDSDGNLWELIPLWLECGINFVLPNEVAAGMDLVAVRRRFGRNLVLLGGLDKRALAASPGQIVEEVNRKARPLLRQGGYFPGPDHSVPPDVSLANYQHYLQFLRSLAG